MPADLRAAVLEGIDQRIKELSSLSLYADDLPALAKNALTALRHLRKLAERHDQGDGICEYCQTAWPCLTLRDLAPDYAPDALKRMEADRG